MPPPVAVPWKDSMIFTVGGGLTRLAEEKFENEAEMENLVGANLREIFPCLLPLKSQFTIGPRDSPGRRGRNSNRFDMLAFDTKRNCFVGIEYKNKVGSHLIDQIFRYISPISKPNSRPVDEYHRIIGKLKMSDDFDWARSYMITVAGGYTQNQIEAADGALIQNPNVLKMYIIRKLEDNVLALDLVMGSPVCKMPTNRSKSRMQKKDVVIKSSPKIQSLFEKLDQEIIKITDVKGIDKKSYRLYKTRWKKTLCTVRRQKSQIHIHYAVRRPSWITEDDEFVRIDSSGRHYASGDYASTISEQDHVDKAVAHLNRIFYDMSEADTRERFKGMNLSIKSQS